MDAYGDLAMIKSRSPGSLIRIVFSLFVIISNVCAPFRAVSVGRVFLDNLTCKTTINSAFSARATPAISIYGHRAIVGLTQSEECIADASLSAPLHLAHSLPSSVALQNIQRTIRPQDSSRPLRC